MRKIIAALITSLDGLIEGPNAELDWVDSWEDPFDLLPHIDTCILGRGMYPGFSSRSTATQVCRYECNWSANCAARSKPVDSRRARSCLRHEHSRLISICPVVLSLKHTNSCLRKAI
jgi:hypothetical protein